MSTVTSTRAFAPASIGNVGVGFDMLGLAIEGPGDRVTARRTDSAGITIAEVRGLDGEIHPFLSADPAQNTASIAARAFWDAHGDGGGVELSVHKGVPLQSGMGSSAASAVAGVVAVNGLLDTPLKTESLLPYALAGEEFASNGLHADNVAPSLLGGLVLCPAVLLPDCIVIRAPSGISSVLVHPELQIDTAQSRSKLARGYTMDQWLSQQGLLAGFLAGCERNDHELLGRCLQDVVIEPQRSGSVPGFERVKEAAMRAGALGCSLSGSGPSMFALCADDRRVKVAAAMEQACRASGYVCQTWMSPADSPGAHLEE